MQKMLQGLFLANILSSLVIIPIGIAFEFNNTIMLLMAMACLLLALFVKWLTTAWSEDLVLAASYLGILSFYSVPLYYLTGEQQKLFFVTSSVTTAGLALFTTILSSKKRTKDILQTLFVAFPLFGVFAPLFGQEDISVPLVGTLCFGLLQGFVVYQLRLRPA